MLEEIEKLRKVPEPAKERLTALITIVVVGAITVVWFLFSISSFFKKSEAPMPASQASSTQSSDTGNAPETPIKAPFAQ